MKSKKKFVKYLPCASTKWERKFISTWNEEVDISDFSVEELKLFNSLIIKLSKVGARIAFTSCGNIFIDGTLFAFERKEKLEK